MAKPGLEVAAWNYLVVRLRVIKSGVWGGGRPPDIIAG